MCSGTPQLMPQCTISIFTPPEGKPTNDALVMCASAYGMNPKSGKFWLTELSQVGKIVHIGLPYCIKFYPLG